MKAVHILYELLLGLLLGGITLLYRVITNSLLRRGSLKL